MFFEHKALYRSIYQEVNDDYYTQEIGKANLLREGDNVTIVSYGAGVHWALEVLEKNPHISADLIDLRTLVPLDTEAIFTSIKKTARVIILHEDCEIGGYGADISALISENCFEYLDAPVIRSGSLNTAVPFAKNLEDNFLAKKGFERKLNDLLNY